MIERIQDAIIEVTRRCNMKCQHCLRGNQQNLDINIDYVDKFFSKIKTIGCLTLSGGEPSLVPHIITQIIESAKRNKTEINNFYIATNAKKITEEFILAVLKLYSYCNENEISLLKYSNDNFHELVDQENVKLLKSLSAARRIESVAFAVAAIHTSL